MTPREKVVVRAIIRALLRKGTSDMDAYAMSFIGSFDISDYYELPPAKRAAVLLEALCSAD